MPSRLAIASTDYVAADRVGVEAWASTPSGWATWATAAPPGVGQYDLAKIDVRGAKVAEVKRPYQLHQDIERMLEWMGPMTDLPPKLG